MEKLYADDNIESTSTEQTGMSNSQSHNSFASDITLNERVNKQIMGIHSLPLIIDRRELLDIKGLQKNKNSSHGEEQSSRLNRVLRLIGWSLVGVERKVKTEESEWCWKGNDFEIV